MGKTEDLAARQEAALAKNAERKRLITELGESNKRLAERVAELEAAGTDVTALRAELDKSNGLLEDLQNAVLSDDEPADPSDDPNAVAGSDKVRRTN